MKNQNSVLIIVIIGLLTLILGLIIGYFAGTSRMSCGMEMMSGGMMGGMHEMMMGDEAGSMMGTSSMMNHGQ